MALQVFVNGIEIAIDEIESALKREMLRALEAEAEKRLVAGMGWVDAAMIQLRLRGPDLDDLQFEVDGPPELFDRAMRALDSGDKYS